MVEYDFCHDLSSFQRQVRASRSVVKGFFVRCPSSRLTTLTKPQFKALIYFFGLAKVLFVEPRSMIHTTLKLSMRVASRAVCLRWQKGINSVVNTRIYRHHARQWYGAKDRTGRLQCAIFESAWSRTIPQAANWYLTISTDISRKMTNNSPFPYSTTARES